MTDFLDEKRREIQQRLEELRPLVEEAERLEAALRALEGLNGAAPTTRATGRTGRPGRPRGSGTRGKQALEIVRNNPGISIPEIAEKMGIKQNYLYRVMPGLQKDGLVRKEGRGWYANEAA
jgi:CRP-like cAMP-binding protein